MIRTLRKGLTISTAVALFVATLFSFAAASDGYDHDSYRTDGRHHAANAYQYDDYYNYNQYYDYNYGYAYSQKPNCSITVTNSSGSNGYDRYITLAWSSSYATTGYISGIGSVGTNGAQAVYYPYNSSYTLTVHGPGGSATCSTNNPMYSSQFYYDSHPYYTYQSQGTYAYPLHAYSAPSYTAYAQPVYSVSLAQIPYTGFDFGVLGNSLYWLGMIIVAMMGAYAIVYSHSGSHPRTFVREVARAARNQMRFVRSKIR